MEPSHPALLSESLVADGFLLAGVVGFAANLWLVAAALVGHGAFDWVHSRFIDNAGVPPWWPGFCLAFDVTLGAIMALLLVSRSSSVRPS
jgi:hypothetical protein